MKNAVRMVIALTAFVFMFGIADVYAQTGSGQSGSSSAGQSNVAQSGGMQGSKDFRCPIWDQLSQDQKQQVKNLRLNTAKRMEALRSEMGKKRLEMMELNMADKRDDQSIEKKQDEMWALRDQMRTERRNMFKQFMSVLTPEQKQKFRLGQSMEGLSPHGSCGMCPQCKMHGKGMGGGMMGGMHHGMMGGMGGMGGHHGMMGGKGMCAHCPMMGGMSRRGDSGMNMSQSNMDMPDHAQNYSMNMPFYDADEE